MDTWSYCLEVEDALQNPKLKDVFGPYLPIALKASQDNTERIEKIARNVLEQKEFDKLKVFVRNFANKSSLLSQKDFKHKSIRESYLEYKNIPDSLAVQTVGTLSEVVADASNRFGYWSDASSKRLNWKAEKILKEQGLDSVQIEKKISTFNKQVDRLITVAENSPETIEDAIKEFKNNISPLFKELNYEIGEAMQDLSAEVQSVDKIVHRERIALDSIIKRERIALSAKADELIESSIEQTFDGISKTLKSLIIYFILLFIVVLGLPFFLGYKLGQRQKKSKKS